jgi:hypothetical protein
MSSGIPPAEPTNIANSWKEISKDRSKVKTLKAGRAEQRAAAMAKAAAAPPAELNANLVAAQAKPVEAVIANVPVKVVSRNLHNINKSKCTNLFDPCTREPIGSLALLEKRVRDIKRELNITPVGLYGLTNETTNYDFLMRVFLDPDISLDDMVSFKLSEGRAKAGTDIFEVLSRIFVFFGGIDGVNPRQGGNYKYMDRIEGGGRIYDDVKVALQSMKCIASRGSGVSDITLVNSGGKREAVKPNDPYCEISCNTEVTEIKKTYIMSCKWRKDEKNAENVDLPKLRIAALNLSPEQQPVDIIVFIKSKKDYEIANNRMYRQYVRELSKTFFGWNEDVKPFLENIRRSIFELSNMKEISPQEALESQYFVANSKPILSLQLHQDIIVKGLCDSLENTLDNRYLIGVLPRGGKTFIAGGVIREYLKRTGIANLNIFWLTAAPGETKTQVEVELLSKFQDFDTFEFIEVITTANFVKRKPHTVFFCSSQLLLATQKATTLKKRDFLMDLIGAKDKLGLVFFDEAHKTGTGDQTKEKLDKLMATYSNYNLPFIFLTATYYNILIDYQIQKEHIFIWDYTDVLATRALATESEQEGALNNLRKRFGPELVNSVIEKRLENGETLDTMAKAYIGFPDLYFVSADFQEETKERFISQNMFRPEAGFSLSSIFAIKPNTSILDIKTSDKNIRSDCYKIFNDLVNPRNIVSLLTPKDTFEDGGDGGEPLRKEEGISIEPSLLARIDKMSSESNSRFRLDENPTLLMFMPTGGQGSNIFYLLCAWASLLMNHTWWKTRYEVACIVEEEALSGENVKRLLNTSSEANNMIHIINKNPKSSILELERRLHCEKGKGLVILAGDKLSMGISLPCTDVVFLFNERKSPDDIIQKMYRALTPSDGKKSAFVVDLNPVRTLAALYGYTKASHKETNTSSELLDIIYDTYSWDSDIFEFSLRKGPNSKPLSFQERLGQLFQMAERDPDNDYRINEDIGGFEKKLSENIKRTIDPDTIRKLQGRFSDQKIKSALSSIGLKEESKVTLEKGKLVIRTPKQPVEGSVGLDTIEIVIDNFIETIADFVKYLSVTSSANTLEDALNEYESNVIDQEGTTLRQNVLRLIKSRTEIKEGENKELLSSLLVLAVKNFAMTSSERIFRQMKGKIDEKSLRKNAVLKIIHKHLTPRKKQKEEKGEVFTPIELVEEMLSHLPAAVWKNPELKWLDPANGIGNFPVVAFYKLNEGLKNWEPNENKRRKHIINNMLYMLEIQSNNTRIARNLFEKLCDTCKPNILTTNSLEMTSAKLKAKGWPEKYDIIIGNPPFNADGLMKGTGFWARFVRLAFDLVAPNGYITFVHPPGWRKFYDPEEKENQGKILYDIREKGWNIDYINVSDQPPKHFPVVDYYVIHAKKSEALTKYDSIFMGIVSKGEANLDYPFIPNIIDKDVLNIINKLFKAEGTSIDIIRGSNFEPGKKDIGKPGIPHYHFTNRTGDKVFYNKEYDSVPEYINKEKVLMTFSGGYEKGRLFAFYSDEKIGVTRTAMYMLTKSKAQGEKLVKFFNSDIITFLMKITQYSAPPNHKNEFKILNQLKMPDSLDYGLTAKENELIKRVVGAKEKEPTEGGAKSHRYTRRKSRT